MKNPDSFILKTVTKILFFFVNIFAIYLLWRGHNLPGGGFIAGLASAISIILLGLALGFGQFEKLLKFDPMRLASWGLLISVGAALLPLVPFFPGSSFFEHTMFHFGNIHIGTTLIFDIGVLMVVVGVSVKVVYVLARSTAKRDSLVAAERYEYASAVEEPVEKAERDQPEEVQHGS